jgi:hypothetical protein
MKARSLPSSSPVVCVQRVHAVNPKDVHGTIEADVAAIP